MDGLHLIQSAWSSPHKFGSIHMFCVHTLQPEIGYYCRCTSDCLRAGITWSAVKIHRTRVAFYKSILRSSYKNEWQNVLQNYVDCAHNSRIVSGVHFCVLSITAVFIFVSLQQFPYIQKRGMQITPPKDILRQYCLVLYSIKFKAY